MTDAERQKQWSRRKADREHHTAELIAELLAAVSEDVATRLIARPSSQGNHHRSPAALIEPDQAPPPAALWLCLQPTERIPGSFATIRASGD
ncbi:hypothetical protein [Azospirillum sp. TSH100]|uniref:hypothetical protein n=1 Tax=Azospirillum sp. TSH100 TaxID=652764 RepID=UPI0010AA3E42|nr:hypothetical protein [Azospirillum sp. TSH100]QCG87451.1 hypothetical protein E6C72_06765 [Azospirillum sp. TSH100]